MVVPASPSPSPAPHAAAGRDHPTYTKMITHALTELGGCSARPGIAGYILDRFSGFPASHDALLSAHLRRLVAEGVLRTDGSDSPSYLFAPAGEKRGPGRPRKDSTPAVPVPVVVGEKRGRGRPRKSPAANPSEKAHTPLLPAKRKRGLSPTPASEDAPLQPGNDDSVTKRGPGRPATQEAAPFRAGAEEATAFQNGGVQSRGASSTSTKRGRGRPRKFKPSAAASAAMSPELGTLPSMPGSKRGRGRPRKEKPLEAAASPISGAAASRGFKRGCGRPTMDRASAPPPPVSAEASMEKLAAAAAAMYAEIRDAGKEAGGGQSRMEKLAAAVAAMSAEGIKRGRGRPRKQKPPAAAAEAAAGVKRGLVESAYEAFFRDMMTEASTRLEDEDSVSGEKTHTEKGVAAPGEGKETRAADAGRVPVSGENASSAPNGATGPDLGPADLADDAASTGIKRPRGRSRKKPAAVDDGVSTGVKRGPGRPRKKPAAADDGVSMGFKRGRGRPRKEKLEAAMPAETGDASSTGVKRGRGRPRKEKLEAAMPAETGDAPSTGVKRGRGSPRKKKPAAASTVVKRGRGRPRKDQSSGTRFAEASGEVLFRDMAEAPGDLVSGEKTRTDCVARGDRKGTRAADAGCVPVSGENAASAHVGAIDSDLGSANL